MKSLQAGIAALVCAGGLAFAAVPASAAPAGAQALAQTTGTVNTNVVQADWHRHHHRHWRRHHGYRAWYRHHRRHHRVCRVRRVRYWHHHHLVVKRVRRCW